MYRIIPAVTIFGEAVYRLVFSGSSEGMAFQDSLLAENADIELLKKAIEHLKSGTRLEIPS